MRIALGGKERPAQPGESWFRRVPESTLGPGSRPLTRGDQPSGITWVMVRDCTIAHRYPVWFLDRLVSAVLVGALDSKLELVRRDGSTALYRFPSKATDVLAEFNPDRPDFVWRETDSVAKRALQLPEVSDLYKTEASERQCS